MGHHEDKMEKEERNRNEERLSDVRVRGWSRPAHIYDYTFVDVCTLPDRCTKRPTAMFLDANHYNII